MNAVGYIGTLASRYNSNAPEEEVATYRKTMHDLLNGNRKRWDLYRSLHFVGDDTVKLAIKNDLKLVLDPDTFALVEAIFHWNADWDIV